MMIKFSVGLVGLMATGSLAINGKHEYYEDLHPDELPDMSDHSSEGVPFWGYLIDDVQEFHFDKLNEMIENRKFGIIRDGPAHQWTALEKWKNVEYLSAELGSVKHIISDTEATIHSIPTRVLNKLQYNATQIDDYQKSLNHRKVLNSTFVDFVESVKDTALPYQSASAGLEHLCGSEHLCEDVSPKNILDLHDKKVIGSEDIEPKVHVSIDKPGTVHGTHYDPFHNLYVQITGRKRFLLMDTLQWNKIHLFPHNHPHARHSQLELEPLEETFNDMHHKIPMHVADLGPGDMLYFPPYVFHRTIPLPDDDLSISINSWGVSPEALFMEALREVRLPPHLLDNSTDQETKELIFRMLTIDIIMHSKGVLPEEAADFLFDLLMQRYHGHIGHALDCHKWGTQHCPDVSHPLTKEIKKEIGKTAHTFETAVKNAKRLSGLTTPVLDMMIADWIEILANYVFKYPMACHMIQCLAFLDHSVCPVEDLI